MNHVGRNRCFGGLSVLIASLAATSAVIAADLQPRSARIKPERFTIDDSHDTSLIRVQFRDDLLIRLRDGRLIDLERGDLAELVQLRALVPNAVWQRAYMNVAEEKLAALRNTAQANLGRETADLNLRFNFVLPAGADAQAVLDGLNALDIVELALPGIKAVEPPLPPDFQDEQAYENPGPSGIGAEPVWASYNVAGAGVKIADVEGDWNFNHLDLPDLGVIGPNPPSGADDDHGTAVVGALAGIDNDWGVKGIAHEADFYVSTVFYGASYQPGTAILAAAEALDAGDIVIIEQQMGGPTGEVVAMEWDPFIYDVIVTATGNGVIIVEAAGNGNQNYDAPIYSTGHFGHWPFLPENDSGAIMVGAGAAPIPFGSDIDRSRLSFSNYGSTVDLQGWGESVWTTGYGFIWSGEGVNLYYTGFFGGTSSASPLVAGACALLQSASKQYTGVTLTPGEVKALLTANSWPQTSGIFPSSQHIGPRPDAKLAIDDLLEICEPGEDCNGNGVADVCDISSGSSLDCNMNGVPDECDITSGASGDCDGNGVPDDCEVAGFVTYVSGQLSPIGDSQPRMFTITEPHEADDDVTLTFTGHGNFAEFFELLNISINGSLIGQVFQSGASDCAEPPNVDALVISAEEFNTAAAGGDAVITIVASVPVDPFLCADDSYVAVEVDYHHSAPGDVDGDGVLDVCDATCAADLDASGDVGFSDLLILLSSWGDVDVPADLDGGGVAFSDLLVLLAAWGAC